MLQTILNHMEHSPTPYHAAARLKTLFFENGYLPLGEATPQPGGKYYWINHDTCVIAFRLPKTAPSGVRISASHADSPCFRLRDDPELVGPYLRLSASPYGGMIYDSWLDRPLSVAGRVFVRTETGLQKRLVDFGRPVALIPRVAIHLNRDVNNGMKYDPARDLIALYGLADDRGSFRKQLAEAAQCGEEDVVSTDLNLYVAQPCQQWGAKNEFISAPRIDGLSTLYACAEAFLRADETENISVFCMFDNEEIGSQSKQGAASPWLADLFDTFTRIYDLPKQRLLNHTFMLSVDNGHAKHPNHPELADPILAPMMGGGVVIKHSQRYATDGLSSGLFSEICRRNGIPTQHYANRPDQRGGGTLGNIAASKVPISTVDIGIAQVAMHSCYETAAVSDIEALCRSILAVYNTEFIYRENEILLKG